MIDPRDLGVGVDGEAAAAPAGPRTREVDLDWRSVAWGMAAFVALVAVTGLVRSAPRAITVLAIGALLGLGLDPVVTKVERRLGGHRAVAVAVVMVGLGAAAALIIALLAPRAVDQARALTGDVDRVVAQINKLPVVGKDLQRAGTADKVRQWIEDLPNRLQGNDTPIGEAALRLADGLLVAGFTILVTVALLLDGPRLVRATCRVVPERRREEAVRIGRLAYATVGRYIAGSLLVAVVAGVATLVAGLILRVPLTPLIAVWVSIFDLVPQIGGAAGGIPFVLLGLTRGAGTAVACAIFFILYLQFENNLLSPLVVGRAVKLSPPATMTAALVGVSAGGVVGALLAVPVVAAAKVVYLELRPTTVPPSDPTTEAPADVTAGA
ncbi:MAG: AI-2E family transporter [Actinobacteria bacterium]|nr:AI-2E family transporter [Actinomycetota bacterium]